jgi:hypothetical protein
MGEGMGTYRNLVGRPERRRPPGRPSIDGRIILNGPSRSGMEW